MIKISIIIGIYNNEKTLKSCIDSILNQTFTDWECIICDDGSIDNSYKILTNYEKRYPNKFIILRNDINCGLSETLNRCLRNATGEYIARMDGDDISLPERFTRQVDFLENNEEYDFVGCNANLFDENGVWGERVLPEKPIKKDLLWTAPFIHPTIIIRKNTLISVGGYRNLKRTQRCEDYDLWFRLYKKEKYGCNIQQKLFHYYEGRESYVKRRYKYRIFEAVMRLEGYMNLGLMPIGMLYAIKPLFIGLIPGKLLRFIKLEIAMRKNSKIK